MKYFAHAFHNSLPKGKASGELEIGETSLSFIKGQSYVSLPLEDICLNVGGASDRLIFISHPEKPEWNIYTSDLSILEHPAFANSETVKRQVRRIKQRKTFNWSVVAVVIAVAIMLTLSPFLFMNQITAGIARQIPAEWEHELGETVFAQYRYENEILGNEEAQAHLDNLTDILLQQLDDPRYEFNIAIANDPALNAFALPGGFMVVNSGLILKADSAEELLGVIAHEISHVTEQHGVRNIIAASGTFLLVQAVVGDASGIMATLAGAAPLLLNQSYSRGFESDADEKGVDLMFSAKVDPEGLISFFKKVIKEQEKSLNDIENEDPWALVENSQVFLNSHPATEERIESIQSLIARQNSGDFRNLDHQFFELQQQVKQLIIEGDADNNESRD